MLEKKDPAVKRLHMLRDARNYFQHNLDELRSLGVRYVVLHGANVIAKSDDPDAAWQAVLNQKVPVVECLLAHIPREGESYFF